MLCQSLMATTELEKCMINLDIFDKMLVESINEVFGYVFGEKTTQIIYGYLEKRSCSIFEIAEKPYIFSSALRTILGSRGGQIIFSSRAGILTPILEKAILKALCHRLGMVFDDSEPVIFEDHVNRLRQAYEKGRPTIKVKTVRFGMEGR